MHMEGKGTAQDASAALLWYETAANNGAPMAMNMLGRCHELGQGTAPDPALAAVWYRRAADTGLDWGLYNLANLLATGRGVTQDRAQALALYTRAAHLGHAKSMNLLARHLEDGLDTAADPQAAKPVISAARPTTPRSCCRPARSSRPCTGYGLHWPTAARRSWRTSCRNWPPRRIHRCALVAPPSL